jgi:soluble lytic murein transglycosylase-like protein
MLGCSTSRSSNIVSLGKTYGYDSLIGHSSEAYEQANRLGSNADVRYPNVANYLDADDFDLALYRENLTHGAVVEFFLQLTGNDEITLPLLYHADRYDISPLLAFSLAFTESSFRPHAVNANATSVDRGLLQLNSRSFPQLAEDDFFHPYTNTNYGMAHLRYCFNRADGDMETAVAIYNAGEGRVLRGETPASTLAYVEKMMDYRGNLEREFRSYIVSRYPSSSEE